MKHFTIFAVVVLVVASLSALASKPPANLVVSTVTGEDGPSVQSIASSDSTQRVAIVNWLIDENGNLKVSNQVRDQVIILGQNVVNPAGGKWRSDWFDTARFTVLNVRIGEETPGYPQCNSQAEPAIEWHWDDALPPLYEDILSYGQGYALYAGIPIHGPRARLVLWIGSECTLDFVAVYLRTE